jgi:peptidyl-prolyl cis-trans isomerase SurA
VTGSQGHALAWRMLLGVGDRAARVITLAVLVLTTTAAIAEAKPRRRVIDGIVAIVDDTCITRSELARFLAPHEAKVARELAARPAERIQAVARLREEALRGLIDRRLFEKDAARRHVEVTDGEIASAVGMLAKQNGMTAAELMAAAKAEGLDEAAYRTELKAQILEGKLVQLELAAANVDWKSLAEDQQATKMAGVREAFAAKLRERAFIEIRN